MALGFLSSRATRIVAPAFHEATRGGGAHVRCEVLGAAKRAAAPLGRRQLCLPGGPPLFIGVGGALSSQNVPRRLGGCSLRSRGRPRRCVEDGRANSRLRHFQEGRDFQRCLFATSARIVIMVRSAQRSLEPAPGTVRSGGASVDWGVGRTEAGPSPSVFGDGGCLASRR